MVLWPFLSCGFSIKYIHSFIHSITRKVKEKIGLSQVGRNAKLQQGVICHTEQFYKLRTFTIFCSWLVWSLTLSTSSDERLCNGTSPSVRLSVCMCRRSMTAATCSCFAASRNRAADIDQCPSWAAGSVTLRAEVRGSTQTCFTVLMIYGNMRS